MWDKMEVFYQVVKAGSFTNAEKILNKSQGTLSRSVAILEERLDARLLHRKIKGLELTRKGEEVFHIAQRMFMDINGLKKKLAEADGVSGKIRISMTDAMSGYIMTELLAEFIEYYPNILFDIITDDNLIDIVQREADIGLRPYNPYNTELIQKYLLTLERGLYASISYIEKHGEPKSLEDLDYHRFIVRFVSSKKPYTDVNWSLKIGRGDKDPRRPVFTANSSDSLMRAAAEGIGITSSYEEMDAHNRYNLKRVLPEEVKEYQKVYLVYPKYLQKIERIKLLEDFLMDKFSHLRI